MLPLDEIVNYYPENLRGFKRSILREYLQYKILEIIFETNMAKKLSFIGGTALRIIYGNHRFSEDLDFDNFNLNEKDFKILAERVKSKLESEGFKIELKLSLKKSFRAFLRFKDILYLNELSFHREKKLLIQIDTEPHGYNYTPEKKYINKFDIFTFINTTPLNILLSQKIFALLNRKRTMGRDIYDIVFLMRKTEPDYDYLAEKIMIKNHKEIWEKLHDFSKNLNLSSMSEDLRPFLIKDSDIKIVRNFKEFIGYYKDNKV